MLRLGTPSGAATWVSTQGRALLRRKCDKRVRVEVKVRK
jgi:hypothetical protein